MWGNCTEALAVRVFNEPECEGPESPLLEPHMSLSYAYDTCAHVYVYIYICVCMYVCMCVYI